MTIENKIGYKILKAGEGMWLYDGTSFADSVYMPLNADESKWSEVTNDFKVSNEGTAPEAEDTTEADAQAMLELQNAEKIAELENNLKNGETDFIKALEKWFAENGSGDAKTIAEERVNKRNEIDSLGKVQQTAQGNGTMADPYKVWKVGMSVVEGDWWMTQDGYLWQAKKSGVPSSSTDAEYWDIPE